MFEIGAACGFFLDEARAAGFSVSGLEISPFAAAHARSLGLDVREEAFPGPEPGPPRDSPRALFDAVCAFYVIEHLENQKEAFSQVSAMLKPGGAITIIAYRGHAGGLEEATIVEQYLTELPTDQFETSRIDGDSNNPTSPVLFVVRKATV